MILGLLLAASIAGPAVTNGAASQRLSAQEQRGKDIYLGVGTASESPIKASVGVPPSEAPAMLLACVNCHGRDGKGKPEGRIVPPDITWEALTKPYGVTHPDGRTHQPYTERLLVRAVCMGFDPAGHQLNAAMPRFQISREDINALILYLKRLAGDSETGITDSTIRIGTIVPTTGPFAETGHAVRSVLTAYFDAINKQGGIYNRRLELKVAALGDSPAEAGANVERWMSEEQPFALVGGVTAGAEKAFVAAAERHQVPWVGPQTMLADTGAATNEHTFSLLSGVEQQAHALIDYARNSAKDPRASMTIVYSERAIPASMVGPLSAYATQGGWSGVRAFNRDRDSPSSRALVDELNSTHTTHILLIAGGREMLEFAAATTRAGSAPILLIPGSLATNDLLTLPATFADRLFVALPSLPSDQTRAGASEYRALADTYRLPDHELASQIAALCSAKVLMQGLKLAGRTLNRAKLITALEGLYDFDTGFMPRIAFGPNRRVGALGAYIVTVDPIAKQFTPITGWLGVD
jgi:ABC-type branched-subunit amino acid transport system substrate-binding protein